MGRRPPQCRCRVRAYGPLPSSTGRQAEVSPCPPAEVVKNVGALFQRLRRSQTASGMRWWNKKDRAKLGTVKIRATNDAVKHYENFAWREVDARPVRPSCSCATKKNTGTLPCGCLEKLRDSNQASCCWRRRHPA